jgi:uncharacterized membrane protein YhaH (DUF805 family)/Tfp pilus assembly protein PilE
MQNRNPYAAPQANVARGDSAEEYGEIKVFSPAGRLGRLRYIGYSFGLTILIGILIGIASALVAVADPTAAVVVAGLGYIAIIAVQFLLTIQRSHDMNVTGWLSLISLIPLAVLVFWIVPGTPGENNYGKPPPPNSAGVVVLACLLPLVMTVGILAAIAIPAYRDYTIRAQVSEGLNLAAGPKAAVVETFQRYETPPADRADAGLSADAADTAGQYVDSVDVVGGTIVVTYGANANALIAGTAVALQPYVMPDESVVWRCGHAAPPGGGVAMDVGASSAGMTSIEPRHLPSACRP